MNNIDTQYQALLYHIKLTGTKKETRNGSVISTFGRQIRHNMAEGFPLLTTKKMYWKGIVAELLWFLKGQTNIRHLLDNDCHIWDGDAFKRYYDKSHEFKGNWPDTKEEFIKRINEDYEFGNKWGEMGPIYGAQWRGWGSLTEYNNILREGKRLKPGVDQISNLLNELKTNPDSRRLMVNAWNVTELDSMVLPPCHYGFQCYTRELSLEERKNLLKNKKDSAIQLAIAETSYVEIDGKEITKSDVIKDLLTIHNIPTRALSLMWSQRSVDTFLGLPFNIASYGLLLCILAELTGMIPDQLIGSFGDVHLYENHIDQANEQLKRTPLVLPKLRINTEFWNPENALGEHNWDRIIHGLQIDDFQIEEYEYHPAIKAPLSN